MAFLSIVIPTLNEEGYLRPLLDCLVEESGQVNFEVIIVDASTGDSTTELARRYVRQLAIRIVKSPVADIGTQRNIGATMAKHEYLLFLDADVVLGPRTIERCLRRLDPQELRVISVRHYPDISSMKTHATLLLIYLLIFLARLLGYPVTNGDFMMTNRQTFRAVNGFKEGFLLGEDTDFGIRAKGMGARHSIEWRAHIIASSRRLTVTSAPRLAFTWAAAYLHVARGKGPVGIRANDRGYPYGKWQAGPL
ncbi:glycosyltransferase family 2 protein [Streptomyces pacificus]|uniref:4,4'-diaponeurosporenoate glycosyltransferase n=1 Tax=Streptomyces pacificus TaxID=2705029 RepID=A0A6A0AXQ6_9ACTN|nr:glycosyltransferase [Streptomyces pacificus]GFH37215.1 glycosyl transferase [Streptomyces pacificus]